MKLTERQCWDTLRKMVANKNKEYRLFLYACFDSNNIEKCNAYASFLRDTFLAKMGLNIQKVKEIAIKLGQNVGKSWDWLNSLSSEDLLLYYDFQCRALQNLYNKAESRYFYTKTNPFIVNNVTIYGRDIAEIIGNTSTTSYAKFNNKPTTLLIMGKPDTEEGEHKVDTNDVEVQKQAISRIMGKVHYIYAMNNSQKIMDHAVVSRFVTFNNCGGEILGVRTYQAIVPAIKMNLHPMPKKRLIKKDIENRAKEVKEIQPEQQKPKAKAMCVGFDAKGVPILKLENKFYNGFGDEVTEDDVVEPLKMSAN